MRAWRGKGGLHGEGRQIPSRKGRASKKSLPVKGKKRYEHVSGRLCDIAHLATKTQMSYVYITILLSES